MAMGSASELEYHLPLARDLKLPDPDEHRKLEADVQEVKRMLSKFLIKLRVVTPRPTAESR
jgi:four helix bundle protein